jgi:hypothetical protein
MRSCMFRDHDTQYKPGITPTALHFTRGIGFAVGDETQSVKLQSVVVSEEPHNVLPLYNADYPLKFTKMFFTQKGGPLQPMSIHITGCVQTSSI